MKILVSACLLGMECRYDGTGKLQKELKELKERHELIPICPELYGGLQTPRNPAERVGTKVMTKMGEDVTAAYEKGAREALRLAQFYGCSHAILKERSPSCGSGIIYDGSFSGTLCDGNGVTAELLMQNGIRIIGESEISELL